MCAKPVRADHSHVIIITMSQLSKTSLGGDMGLTLKTLTPEPSTVTRPKLVLPTTLFGAFSLQGEGGTSSFWASLSTSERQEAWSACSELPEEQQLG